MLTRTKTPHELLETALGVLALSDALARSMSGGARSDAAEVAALVAAAANLEVCTAAVVAAGLDHLRGFELRLAGATLHRSVAVIGQVRLTLELVVVERTVSS